MPSLNDNTLPTANNLGVLSGALDINDSFNSVDRLAFYKFTLAQNSDLSVAFNGTSLTAQLISDINGNGTVENNEILTSRFGSIENFLEPLPFGTYFIQLRTNSSLQTNPYTLRLAETSRPGNVFPDPGNTLTQAIDLGALSGQRSLKDYVGDLDEIDFYKFTLAENSNLGVVITGASSLTSVRLISDNNANGIIDGGEAFVGSTGNGSFSRNLPAGTYFISIGAPTVSTQYELALTQTVDLSGDNVLTGTPTRDVINGLTGNDTIVGLGGNDRLLGDAGNDRLSGDAGNDTLIGGSGNDRLDGKSGNDVLLGGGDRDVLIGGSGNDRLDGEAGNDVITTGAGRDRVVLRRRQGFDRVTDFQNNQDRIDLVGIRFGQLTLQQQRNDVLVKLGRSNVLLIEDTNLRAINRADFV